jgi:predicted small lipoprotein YifL
MIVRRCTAILLLVICLAVAGCGGALIPPSDEVTTRMNARDEQALDDGALRHDAGAPPDATSPRP